MYIKEILLKIIGDIYENNMHGNGFLIEYKIIPEKRCMEIILDLGSTSCNIDYIDGFVNAHDTDTNHIIAHLMEKSDKITLMKDAKKVVLNIVY